MLALEAVIAQVSPRPAFYGRSRSRSRSFRSCRRSARTSNIIAPATFLSLLVPLAVFFAFQRYFVQGLLVGSVK